MRKLTVIAITNSTRSLSSYWRKHDMHATSQLSTCSHGENKSDCLRFSFQLS